MPLAAMRHDFGAGIVAMVAGRMELTISARGQDARDGR